MGIDSIRLLRYNKNRKTKETVVKIVIKKQVKKLINIKINLKWPQGGVTV